MTRLITADPSLIDQLCVVLTNLVNVDQREKFLDFLRSDHELWRDVPVRAGHLVPHLVHSSRRRSDADAAGLVEAHGLRRKTTP